MTDEQYILVMNYFNEISALVKSYGMTPRAWNDGLMYGDTSGKCRPRLTDHGISIRQQPLRCFLRHLV